MQCKHGIFTYKLTLNIWFIIVIYHTLVWTYDCWLKAPAKLLAKNDKQQRSTKEMNAHTQLQWGKSKSEPTLQCSLQALIASQ